MVRGDRSFQPDTEAKHNLGGVPQNKLLHKLTQNRSLVSVARGIVPDSLWPAVQRLRRKNMQPAPALEHKDRQMVLDFYANDFDTLSELCEQDVATVWYPDRA